MPTKRKSTSPRKPRPTGSDYYRRNGETPVMLAVPQADIDVIDAACAAQGCSRAWWLRTYGIPAAVAEARRVTGTEAKPE